MNWGSFALILMVIGVTVGTIVAVSRYAEIAPPPPQVIPPPILTASGEDFIPARPRPRIATVRAAPSRDEFAAWRDDPITQFVFAALDRNAVECEESWLATSWQNGVSDPIKLTALRERADALRSMSEADYEAFCETLGVEPEAAQAEDAA